MKSEAENQLNCIITQTIQVSPIMKIIRVTPDNWELPNFEAGQFVAVWLPESAPRCKEATPEFEEHKPGKLIKRAYSIASSSKTQQYIEFYITLVHSGALTPRIFNLEIGDRIGMGNRIVGMFTLDQVPEDKDVVLIATGTGVAPYMSMLRSDALGKKRKIAVIHGAANSWDLGYSSELQLLTSMTDKLTYISTITCPDKEPTPWRGEARYIEEIWKDKYVEEAFGYKPNPEKTHVFLCGNPRMIDNMCELLEADGFIRHKKKQPGQIHVEEF